MIVEINNTKYVFVKTSMQIIHTVYYINLYFLAIDNTHSRIYTH